MKRKPRQRRPGKRKPRANPTAVIKADTPEAVLDRVIRWIVNGASEHQVCQEIAEAWPTTDARPLIVQAMTKIAENAQASPELVRGWCFEATREVYRLALATGRLSVALRAVKQLSDLAG